MRNEDSAQPRALGRRAAGLAVIVVTGAASPAGAIVGGAPGGPGEAATVMVLNDQGGVCTGIVVAPAAVLTAAHCAPAGAALRVHYKETDGTPALLPPREAIRHPGFDARAIQSRTRSIDLALLRLPADLPARFQPATLAAAAPRQGERVTASGWGVSAEGRPETTGTYRHAMLGVIEPYGPSRILLWAADPATGGKTAGAGVCQGDSGGPIWQGGAVIAVSTWSTGPAGRQCGLLSQSVRLGQQRGWIDATLARWGLAAAWRD